VNREDYYDSDDRPRGVIIPLGWLFKWLWKRFFAGRFKRRRYYELKD
jgi:hypothetical protein